MSPLNHSISRVIQLSRISTLNIPLLQKKYDGEEHGYTTQDSPHSTSNNSLSLLSNEQIAAKVLSSSFFSEKLKKVSSPQLRVALGQTILTAIVDEGSELNCICSSYAARLRLKFKKVNISAMAAGLSPMTI